jgi:hypothetical protein
MFLIVRLFCLKLTLSEWSMLTTPLAPELLELQQALEFLQNASYVWNKEAEGMDDNALTHTKAYLKWLHNADEPLLWFRSTTDIKISTVLGRAQKSHGKMYSPNKLSELQTVYYSGKERMTNTLPSTSQSDVVQNLILQVLQLHCKDGLLHETLVDLLKDTPSWTPSAVCSVLLHKPDIEKLLDLLGIIAHNSRFSLMFALEHLDSVDDFRSLLVPLSLISRHDRHKVICSLTNSLDRLLEGSDLGWCVTPDTEYQGKIQFRFPSSFLTFKHK